MNGPACSVGVKPDVGNMQSTNNKRVDEWLEQIVQSERASPEQLHRAWSLSKEATMQWKRKCLVETMTARLLKEQVRAVPIFDIADEYGVHFTHETMKIVEDGIQQSLRNFCEMTHGTLKMWERDVSERGDVLFQQHRVELAVGQSHCCLWGSLDSMDTSPRTVHLRATEAVRRLWQAHAVPAIEVERQTLHEHMLRIRTIKKACDEFVAPLNGGKAIPFKFDSCYDRKGHELAEALGVISSNTSLFQTYPDMSRLVTQMEGAFRRSVTDARAWMTDHASTMSDLFDSVSRALRDAINTPSDSDAWHGLVVEGDLGPRSRCVGVTSAALQPPGYSAMFWKTSRVRVMEPATATTVWSPVFPLPVVRYCALLKQLVENEYLRLDIVGIDYLTLLASAEHARYMRNVEKIVKDVLAPLGHLGGAFFDMSWFHETRAPVVCTYMKPLRSELSFSLYEDDDAVSRKSDDRHVDIDASPNAVIAAHSGGTVDHCVMVILTIVATSHVSEPHINPHGTAFHIGMQELEGHLRSCMGGIFRCSPYECLNQHVSRVLKMFATALRESGICAHYGTDKAHHPRTKKLKISWGQEPYHLHKTLEAAAALATRVVSHLQHGTPLPANVSWCPTQRSRRRPGRVCR